MCCGQEIPRPPGCLRDAGPCGGCHQATYQHKLTLTLANSESSLLSRFEELRSERIAKYQGMNLYVKNLHDDLDDEQLRSEFSQVCFVS